MKLLRSQPLVTALVLVLSLAALAVVAYAFLLGQTQGSKVMTAFAVLIAISPAAIYAALKRPLLFPFCLYVVFVPFDELLSLSRFGTMTRLLAVLAGVAIAFWLIRSRRVNTPPKSLGWWAAVLGWMLLTVFWAIDPILALGRIQSLAQIIVLYAALCLMEIRLSELKAVLTTAVISGTAAAIYGAYYFHQNLGTIIKRLALANAEGDVIDPNHFAASLIMPIAIVTVAALTARSIFVKLFLLGVDLVLFVGVYESGSRGSIVAIGVVFLFLFWALRSRWQLVFIAVCAALPSLFLPVSIWDRFGRAISSGGAGRTAIWHVGYTAFKQFWLLGAGAGNFPLAYDRAYLNVFSTYAHWGRGSHNLVVGTAVELGAIGLFLMMAAWAVQYLILNEIPKNNPLYNFRIMAQASTLGLLTASFFLDLMYTKYTWLVFMIAALTYSVWKASKHDSLTRPPASAADSVIVLAPARQPVTIGIGNGE